VSELSSFPVVTFLTELDPTTKKELDSLTAQLSGYLSAAGFKEGGDFGTIHGANVTAESVTTVDLEVTGTATIADAQIADGDIAGRFSGEVNASILRLTPYETWAVQTGDTDLLNQGNVPPSPQTTLWYLTRAGSDTVVNGIAANLVTGNPGQVITLINDSVYFLSFESAVVTSAKRIYGCNPAVKIGPGGMIAFVYDTVHLGWRLLCHTRDYYADPCGMIQIQAMASVKPGWLELGQAVSRTDYAALFAEIGTTWGAGNGTTTFDLPPKGIFPILTGGTPGLSLGATGGAWNHTHTVPNTSAEAAHTHGGGSLSAASDGAHTHDVEGTTGAGSAHAHGIPFTTADIQAGSGHEVIETVGGFDESTDVEDEHTHGAGSLAAASDGAHTHSISGSTDAGGGHSHTIAATGAANPPYAAFVGVIRA